MRERQQIVALEKKREQRREKLPNDRKGTTLHFTIIERYEDSTTGEAKVREVKGYLSTGEYEDGRLGEVFFKLGKAGSSEALLDQLGVASSMALQYGCGVDELFGKYVNTRFEPSGAVLGVGGVQRCTSVLDMAARFLIARYGAVKT
jgi:ribonucleoside-diphosphate reductase alpha chain